MLILSVMRRTHGITATWNGPTFGYPNVDAVNEAFNAVGFNDLSFYDIFKASFKCSRKHFYNFNFQTRFIGQSDSDIDLKSQNEGIDWIDYHLRDKNKTAVG